ncbi:MAG: NAD-dependent epimerase/dehydratase family protein [Acidimicrobiales bacterium]
MRIFVAGATGVVGQRVVGLLARAGHAVTGLSRSAAKQALLESLGATASAVDMFDRQGLTGAVDGHDAVVNLATHIPTFSKAALPKAWAENDRIRTEGSRNLVDAALAARAGLYVQESVTFAYPDMGDGWIDETVPFEPVANVASVAAAESHAQRFTDAECTGVVLRFGLFYAADSSHTASIVKAARWKMAVTLGRPGAYMSSIHADDAASAVLGALSVGPGVYNVVDDEPLTRKENADVLATALGVGRPVMAPAVVAGIGGSKTRLLARSQRVSNKRFRQASGWAPLYPSAREGWPAVVAQLRAAETNS